MEGLLIGFAGGVRPSGCLGELLFRSEIRETRFDPADGVDKGNRRAAVGGGIGRRPTAAACAAALWTSPRATPTGLSFAPGDAGADWVNVSV
jgi:hypothetical protein